MGHWYQQDGSPLYTVPKADGKGERDTTLRDARKLNLVPSVTTILGIVDKPALSKWKTEQLLNAIHENPFQYGSETWGQYKSRVLKLSEKVGKDAAEKGNIIHNALEQFYSVGDMDGIPKDVQDFCKPAIWLITETFGDLYWHAEKSFSHPMGFGGKCDLHLSTGGGTILDFKTKSAEDFSKVRAYSEQCQQLVAYREGFNLPEAECYNLFIGTTKPGDLLLHKWDEKECQKAWECFKHLVGYWKLSNNIK